MFKKSASVAFKGETRLRGKEAKKLRDAVATQFGGEASAVALLPGKADIVVRKAGGGSVMHFLFVDGACFLVQPDGRAELGDAELVPTLSALWRAGADVLPCVLLQPPVAKFVFRGANVMAPGIRTVLPARGAETLPPVGALVAVRVVGNPSACAIGRLQLPPAMVCVAGTKGEAVEVLHFFGDALWEACGSQRPDGFVGDEVCVTNAAEAESLLGGRHVAEVARCDKIGGDSGTPRSQVKTSSPRAESTADATTGEACSLEMQQMSPKDMDIALAQCFLQTAKTRVKDKDLPIAGNALYAQHMRPCRKAGSNLDVKLSTWKRLAAFLVHLEELGYLALKKGEADPVVTKICRDHPDISSWRPWPRSETAEAAEGGGAGGSAGAPSVTIEVEPVWRLNARLLSLVEGLGPSDDHIVPEDGCWKRELFASALRRYADSKDLWLRNNRKRISPDDLIANILGGHDPSEAGGLSLDGLVDKVLQSLPACHRVRSPQGGAKGGFKQTLRPGKPPVVQVRTDRRRGHAVTLAYGLEAYGVDMEALASFLQKALAASASVETEPQLAVMVQGFWDVAMVEWLGKVGIPTESIQQTAKKGQQQKKSKEATNIVKH